MMEESIFTKSSLDRRKLASKSIAVENSVPNGVRYAFDAVLQIIYKKQWYGACHATSAMLFIALTEQGFEPCLHLGQGKADKFFDHSWVTLDGKIYDAAIAFNLADKQYGGPVFCGIDLDTRGEAAMLYGNSDLPFDEQTVGIKNASISEYMDGSGFMWPLLCDVFKRVGIPYNEAVLREKYKNVGWEVEPVRWATAKGGRL